MGVMVRFSAGEEEIAALLRFMTRRAQGGLRLVPLAAPTRDGLRFRHTTRPLLRFLAENDEPSAWGLRMLSGKAGKPSEPPPPLLLPHRHAENGNLLVDPEASRLIVFQFGPACGSERRREALIEARDEVDAPQVTSSATASPPPLRSRDLVERCARRVRRRGALQNGRWYVP